MDTLSTLDGNLAVIPAAAHAGSPHQSVVPKLTAACMHAGACRHTQMLATKPKANSLLCNPSKHAG